MIWLSPFFFPVCHFFLVRFTHCVCVSFVTRVPLAVYQEDEFQVIQCILHASLHACSGLVMLVVACRRCRQFSWWQGTEEEPGSNLAVALYTQCGIWLGCWFVQEQWCYSIGSCLRITARLYVITWCSDSETLLQFDMTLYALRRKHKVALGIKICLYSDSIVRLGLPF